MGLEEFMGSMMLAERVEIRDRTLCIEVRVVLMEVDDEEEGEHSAVMELVKFVDQKELLDTGTNNVAIIIIVATPIHQPHIQKKYKPEHKCPRYHSIDEVGATKACVSKWVAVRVVRGVSAEWEGCKEEKCKEEKGEMKDGSRSDADCVSMSCNAEGKYEMLQQSA
ncbi:hypothetical protein BDQ17DRAFT_1334122 [Cyathus striatus]|nr:hypothetical protein BDQ17DRAFT_1334122 [Cyathus striatus]